MTTKNRSCRSPTATGSKTYILCRQPVRGLRTATQCPESTARWGDAPHRRGCSEPLDSEEEEERRRLPFPRASSSLASPRRRSFFFLSFFSRLRSFFSRFRFLRSL